MERHGRAGETSEPKSHPINESPDRSKSTSYKNILGSEITAIDLSVQGPPVLFTRASNSWITSKWPSNLESGILFLSALGGFPDLQKPQRME
ncbi:hypothetical protein BN1708_015332 [Verticillium longisporum]|uniref:Uncharacterized protein n=1 Tax=Verticillium longisporum TaxID=100787 RepID=A0A0G4M3J0_VERLO|nr:hypothetical protein BN1708_015332 [Verticillium longisporum]